MALKARKRVVLLCPNPAEVSALMREARALQSGGSDADWPLNLGNPATLGEVNDRFQLGRDRLPPELGVTPFARWKKYETLSLDIVNTLPEGKLHGLVLYVPAAVKTDDLQRFLDDLIARLNQPEAQRPATALIVIGDALSLLSPGLPPVDAVERWDQLRSGLSAAVPPVDLARSPDAWRAPVLQLNARLGQRLAGCEAALARLGCMVGLLPVCQTGFHVTTGEVLSPQENAPAIAFNIRPMVQVMAGFPRETLPSFAGWGAA